MRIDSSAGVASSTAGDDRPGRRATPTSPVGLSAVVKRDTFAALGLAALGLVVASFVVLGFARLVFSYRVASYLSAPTALLAAGLALLLLVQSVLSVTGLRRLE